MRGTKRARARVSGVSDITDGACAVCDHKQFEPSCRVCYEEASHGAGLPRQVEERGTTASESPSVADASVREALEWLHQSEPCSTCALWGHTCSPGHIPDDCPFDAALATLTAALADRERLAKECAALGRWAVLNDRIGYEAVGDTDAWLATAAKETS